jgi:hypothetical protein
MLTKLCFPTMVVAGPGMAMGQPIDVAIATIVASAAALCASAEKAPGKIDSFGKMITKAVKARRAKPRVGVFAQSASEPEEKGFGEKIAEAIKRKTASRSGTRQGHEKAAEAEGTRYHPIKRRPRTLSD